MTLVVCKAQSYPVERSCRWGPRDWSSDTLRLGGGGWGIRLRLGPCHVGISPGPHEVIPPWGGWRGRLAKRGLGVGVTTISRCLWGWGRGAYMQGRREVNKHDGQQSGRSSVPQCSNFVFTIFCIFCVFVVIFFLFKPAAVRVAECY